MILKLVEEFRSKGLADREIAILYPRKEGRRIDDLCRMLRESVPVCWISNDKDPNGGAKSIGKPGVRLSTIHTAKGLEFQAVILAALDLLPMPNAPMGPCRSAAFSNQSAISANVSAGVA